MSLACWHAIRRHARYAVVLVGAVTSDMCQGRYPGEMVASAPVGDAEVMPGLGPVPLAGGIALQRSGERTVPTSRKKSAR